MSDTLRADEELRIGDALTSTNGEYYLVLQADGNLVLYRIGGIPLWASHTVGAKATRVLLQKDGNFVLYTENGHAWSSRVVGDHPDVYLVMQDDGNLVAYSKGRDIWSTGTNYLDQLVGLFDQMSENVIQEVCNECGISIIAGAVGGAGSAPPGGRASGAAFGAALAALASSDCRRCVREAWERRSSERIAARLSELTLPAGRPARDRDWERFREMDRINDALERFDRYRNTA